MDRPPADDYVGVPGADGEADIDPFDAEAVNARVAPLGLVYGAGLVGLGRPVFFLAELHDGTARDGLEVLAAGRELARGLLAPPAALAGEGRGRSCCAARPSPAGPEQRETLTLRPQTRGPLRALVEAYGLDGDFRRAAALAGRAERDDGPARTRRAPRGAAPRA